MAGWNSKTVTTSKLRSIKGASQAKVNDDIFDKLNLIVNSVNRGKTTKEIPQASGKSGDIRVAKSSTGAYHLEAKTDEGWIRSDSAIDSGFRFKDKSDTILGTSEGWLEMTPLMDDWETVSGYASASYRKKGGIVYLQGRITGGSSSTAQIFRLPEGYRPGAPRVLFPGVGSNGNLVYIHILGSEFADIGTNGKLYPLYYDDPSGELSLDGINFFHA